MPRSVSVRLPSAPARVYRSWIEYWRRLDGTIQASGTHPDRDAPVARDPAAIYLSDEIMPQIEDQTSGARDEMVAPRLEVDPRLAMGAVEFLARQAHRLSPRLHAELGLEPPSEEVEDIRARVLVTLRIEVGRIARPS